MRLNTSIIDVIPSGVAASLRVFVLLCCLVVGLPSVFGQNVGFEEISTTVYEYDVMHRLVGQQTTSGNGQLAARVYGYDAVGNVTELDDGLSGTTHRYEYDPYYRLSAASGDYGGSANYSLLMAYDGMHRITGKGQMMAQQNVMFPGYVQSGYGLEYIYSKSRRFQLDSIIDRNFRTPGSTATDRILNIHTYSYDGAGNMTGVRTSRQRLDGHEERLIAERKLLWDDESRLLALDDNGFISTFLYDADGNRTVKLPGGGCGLYIDGDLRHGSTVTSNYTVYPNPNTVYTGGNKLSRHIYAGSERVLSAVGYGHSPTGTRPGTTKVPFTTKKHALEDSVRAIYEVFEVPFHGRVNDDESIYTALGLTGDSGEARASHSDTTAVYFYHPDHLGSTTLVTDGQGAVTQMVEYVPFGEVFVERRFGNSWASPYLFNAKEYDEETGLYYYGARYYDPRLSLWLSPDPLALEYPGVSAYCYTNNNPVKYIDPDGMEVIVTGNDIENAIKQLQSRVGKNMTLKINESGNLSYTTSNPSKKLHGDAKRVASIIDDKNITIQLKTTTGDQTSNGRLLVGGAFMGNEITESKNGNIKAIANQEVNPSVLNSISEAHGKPGADMLHEVTEAYEGAKISIKNGISSPMGNEPNSVYEQAHRAATSQSGPVYERVYDKNGYETKSYKNAARAEWYVNDRQGKQIIVHKIP